MLSRMLIFIVERCKPIELLLNSFFVCFGLLFFSRICAGYDNLIIDKYFYISVATLFLLLIIMRISDELKDKEVDFKLFPERCLPSGRVKYNDIKILGLTAFGIILIVNALIISEYLIFSILIIYLILFYKYFFIKKILSRNIIAALITHNPIVLVINIHLINLMNIEHTNASVINSDNIYISIIYWLPALAWEVSRKIKIPCSENEYDTYSKILGYKLASAIPVISFLIQLLLIVLLVRLHNITNNVIILFLLPILGYTIFLISFVKKPTKYLVKYLGKTTELVMLIEYISVFVLWITLWN